MQNCNISQSLTRVASDSSERTALVSSGLFGTAKWSFAEMEMNASAYAHGLAAHGISRGTRVMLMVKPSMEFLCLTFALFKIGAVVILIDPGMGYRNLLRSISQVRPEAFVGIPKAHLFKLLYPLPFQTVKKSFLVISGIRIISGGMKKIADYSKGDFPCVASRKDDLAAIIFTTGSTGPPKGVQYTHGVFQAQLTLIREHYGITEADIDQPAFPLFGLFTIALGACAVLPRMDAARPAQVDPEKFIKTIVEHKVTYSFGSPAIWNVISRYCLKKNIILTSLKKILMAGAPVPGELIRRVSRVLPPDAEIHTPYGATECLPVSSMTGSVILKETWDLTRAGKGACVGRPLPGIEICIIETTEGPITDWQNAVVLPDGEIGEIVVKGDVVTHAYDRNEKENAVAKIPDNGSFWHRIGDVGYFDAAGRLWFCGRKAHRVMTGEGIMYTIPCEALFNEHPKVFRSALIGIGKPGFQEPVLIAEPFSSPSDPDRLIAELAAIAKGHTLTKSIRKIMLHPSFPVDIRHNAKIFREKLAVWAEEQMK